VYAARATIVDFWRFFARHFPFCPAIFLPVPLARAKIRDFLRTFARRFWGDDTPTDRPTG
jgi:hypothetical protein